MIDREILFRKFQVSKKSNHYKYVPLLRYVVPKQFVPHKKLLVGMERCERKHQKTNPKAVLTLKRIEKKYMSLRRRLRKAYGL